MKNRCLLMIVLLFFSCSVLSLFADTTKPKQILTKADLPEGYYLKTNQKETNKNQCYYRERWDTLSPIEEKYYKERYNSSIKNTKPVSSLTITTYYFDKPVSDDFIRYHKGSVIDPLWINTTPGGKKLGDQCWSLSKVYANGLIAIITIIKKDNSLCIIDIRNQKNSKSIPKESVEKLIETIYNRL